MMVRPSRHARHTEPAISCWAVPLFRSPQASSNAAVAHLALSRRSACRQARIVRCYGALVCLQRTRRARVAAGLCGEPIAPVPYRFPPSDSPARAARSSSGARAVPGVGHRHQGGAGRSAATHGSHQQRRSRRRCPRHRGRAVRRRSRARVRRHVGRRRSDAHATARHRRRPLPSSPRTAAVEPPADVGTERLVVPARTRGRAEGGSGSGAP